MRSTDNKINTRLNKLIKVEVAKASQRAQDYLYGVARRAIGTVENSQYNIRQREAGWSEQTQSGKKKMITVKSFYGDYDPKVYQRTGNLENSFGVFESKHTTDSVVVNLSFAKKYMPYSTHKPTFSIKRLSNGATRYDKDAVLKYGYGEGWHGHPSKRNHQSIPSPRENVIEGFKSITMFNLIPPEESNEILDEFLHIVEDEFFDKTVPNMFPR